MIKNRSVFFFFIPFYLLSLLIVSCSTQEDKNTDNKNQRSPTKVVKAWFNALEQKDIPTIYSLISKDSWTNLDKNLRLYLETLENIDESKKEEIEKTLQLHNEAFLEKIFTNYIGNIPKIHYDISEVQTGQSTAKINLMLNTEATTIALVKNNDQWFIQASSINIPSGFTKNKKKLTK